MAAIRELEPDTEFTGVGGETMLAQGLRCLAPLDDLAVNGFREPLLRLPQPGPAPAPSMPSFRGRADGCRGGRRLQRLQPDARAPG